MSSARGRSGAKAKSSKVLPKSIKEVLKRYKDVLSKGLSQELPLKRKMDHKIKVIQEADPHPRLCIC